MWKEKEAITTVAAPWAACHSCLKVHLLEALLFALLLSCFGRICKSGACPAGPLIWAGMVVFINDSKLKKEEELIWVVYDFSLVRSGKCQGRKQSSFRAGNANIFTANIVTAASPVGGYRVVLIYWFWDVTILTCLGFFDCLLVSQGSQNLTSHIQTAHSKDLHRHS